MKIQLFGNYTGVYQPSMRHYGHALQEALHRALGPADQVDLVEPGNGGAKTRWSGYWTRYVAYPLETSRRASADINHIVDHSYSYLAYALPADRTVITCHDLIVQRQKAGLLPGMEPFGWTSHFFARQMQGLRRAAHIVTVSEQTRDDLIQFLHIPREKITVVYSGVDAIFTPLPAAEIARIRAERKWDHWPYCILHVGGSFLYKNIAGLLRALALLREQQLDVHLIKAGSALGPAEETLARQLNVQEAVHALGPISLQDLHRVYNAVDVLAFPSWWEGFGWPPLEAMACGTVVAASDRGALRETLGDAAVIIPPEDPAKMASGLRRALTDDALRKTLRQRGLEHARRFTWDKTAREILHVYDRVLSSATSPCAKVA